MIRQLGQGGELLAILLLSACEAHAPRPDLRASAELPDAGARSPVPPPETLGPLPFLGSDAALPLDTRCGTPPDAVECPEFLLTFDGVYRALLADLDAQRPEDRPFTRYLGLVNRRNAGVCGAALDVDRWALSKLLNSLSTESAIALPEAIDAERTIYRIDLRRYGWDREIVDAYGTVFSDAWEAILGNNDYAVPFEAGAADGVRASALTALPYLSADAFVDGAGLAGLYYALLGVPAAGQSSSDFQFGLGVDASDQVNRGIARAAGFRGSRISQQPRVVYRYPLAAERVFWSAFDFSADVTTSVFDDPLGFVEGGTFSIYSLPNLLHGYVISDENGLIADVSDLLFVDNARIYPGVSCMGCHAQGILPVVDQVRAYVEANPTNYAPDEATAIQALFTTPGEMASLVAADRDVYQGALTQLGLPTDCPDPVSQVATRFARPLTLRTALGDLGIHQAAFEAAQLGLPASVAGLLNVGQLEREAFGALYLATLCATTAAASPDAGEAIPSAELCSELTAAGDSL